MSAADKMIARRTRLRHKIEFLELLLNAWLQRKFDTVYVGELRERLRYHKRLMDNMREL